MCGDLAVSSTYMSSHVVQWCTDICALHLIESPQKSFSDVCVHVIVYALTMVLKDTFPPGTVFANM